MGELHLEIIVDRMIATADESLYVCALCSDFDLEGRRAGEFLKKLAVENYSRKTIESRRYSIDRLCEYLRERRFIAELEARDILGFFSWLRSTPHKRRKRQYLSVATINSIGFGLREFFKYCHAQEYITVDLVAAVPEAVNEKKLAVTTISLDDYDTICRVIDLSTPQGFRDRVLVEILYNSGLRLGEALALGVSHIDLNERLLFVKEGKGKKDRVCPMTERLVVIMNKYLQDVRPRLAYGPHSAPDALLLSSTGNKLAIGSAGKRISDIGKRAGLGYRLHAHLFRHTCAMHMLQRGCDIRYISQLLGHTRLQTTQIYTEIVDEDLRSKLEEFHFLRDDPL